MPTSFFLSLFQGLAGAGSVISDTGAALAAFFTTITDYTMWRSIGWLALGVVLIAGGTALWVKGELLHV